VKNKWIGIGIVCAVVVIGLVAYNLRGEGGSSPVELEGNSSREERYADVPVGESFAVSSGIVMDKAISPAFFEFEEVVPGAVIDTWTADGHAVVGGDWVSYRLGEQLWLLVYNGLDSSVTYSLKCVNAPREVNHSEATGKDYFQAPGEFLAGVSLPSMITIEAHSAMKIPLRLQFPADIEYPDQWEFRISVFDLKVQGMVETGLEFRFFTTMR